MPRTDWAQRRSTSRKAIVYFEVVTTLALVIGLIVANLWQPGAGLNVDPVTIDAKSIQQYVAKAHEQSALDYVTHIIPATIVGAFAEGEILQVLFFSLLFASALSFIGEPAKPLLRMIDLVGRGIFGVIAIIVRAAPAGALARWRLRSANTVLARCCRSGT